MFQVDGWAPETFWNWVQTWPFKFRVDDVWGRDMKWVEISKIILESWFSSWAHSNDTNVRMVTVNLASSMLFCLKILNRYVSKFQFLLSNLEKFSLSRGLLRKSTKLNIFTEEQETLWLLFHIVLIKHLQWISFTSRVASRWILMKMSN